MTNTIVLICAFAGYPASASAAIVLIPGVANFSGTSGPTESITSSTREIAFSIFAAYPHDEHSITSSSPDGA